MVTALTLYGANTISPTLNATGASLFFANTTGGALTSHTTKIGTSTGYGEVATFNKTTNWEALSTIGNPQGFGWIWDVTTMEGQQLVAGPWTPTLTFQTSVGSIVADIHMRAFVYNAPNATFTQIGTDMIFSGTTINTTASAYTFPPTTLPAQNFGSGDKLYCGVWLNITANSTGSTTATVKMYLSNDASLGSTSVQVVTPGYQATPGGSPTAVTITNAGLNMTRDGLSGANSPFISYIALGTSSTAPTINDTQLGAEVFRKKVTSYTNGTNPGEVLISVFLAPGDAVGDNIAEIGFFGGAYANATPGSGVLFARMLYSHTKQNTENIQITLDLTS